ncbi:MAG TPA: sulfatase [Limnochordia bacterium]|nr:sulfatase [Limnochordia bacterium]
MPQAPPNIIYIHSHDTGRAIQPYGHACATPHLMRLAEAGVLFRRAFCAAPTCSPSRAALLTGQSAHQAGMLGLTHRGFGLYDYTQHIVHALRRAGYTSALSGVQHIARDPEQIGYDRVLGRDQAERRAADWLTSGEAKEPFFLAVGFGETHRVAGPHRGFHPESPQGEARHVRVPAVHPDTPTVRADWADFYACAARLDAKIGTVLAALEAAGLSERTLVVYTTDHGPAFPEMKCNLTDHGTGVALIMRGPGFTGGKTVDAMVSHLDLYPTWCELAGVAKPAWSSGEPLLPLARGERDTLHDAVFAEVSHHAAYEPMRAVRTERWKYIRRFGDRRRRVLPNCDDGFTKTYLLEHGWADEPVPEEALYDLALDPAERVNRAGDPALAATLAELRGRLEAWMHTTDDPLLAGPIPVPPGGRTTDPDAISPDGRR